MNNICLVWVLFFAQILIVVFKISKIRRNLSFDVLYTKANMFNNQLGLEDEPDKTDIKLQIAIVYLNIIYHLTVTIVIIETLNKYIFY
jgi:hypothetical protein